MESVVFTRNHAVSDLGLIELSFGLVIEMPERRRGLHAGFLVLAGLSAGGQALPNADAGSQHAFRAQRCISSISLSFGSLGMWPVKCGNPNSGPHVRGGGTMAKIERVRQDVSPSFGADDLRRQSEKGWNLVAVEWERELPDKAA